MGFTTRVKSEASEKKPFNFALFWDKYGTFFILAIIVAIPAGRFIQNLEHRKPWIIGSLAILITKRET